MRLPLSIKRLTLRNWRPDDCARVREISLQPGVQAGLGAVQDAAARVRRVMERCDMSQTDGYHMAALEHRESGILIGWCGFKRVTVGPVSGAIEIGWTLADEWTGQGFAMEAAEVCLAEAATVWPRETIYAYTAAINQRSRRLMERLGMVRRAELDFDHPEVDPQSALRPHVMYSRSLAP